MILLITLLFLMLISLYLCAVMHSREQQTAEQSASLMDGSVRCGKVRFSIHFKGSCGQLATRLPQLSPLQLCLCYSDCNAADSEESSKNLHENNIQN